MKKVTYIRCPRCELNYITKGEKYCSVCKQEMQVGGGENLDDLDMELCPICKVNYIQPDEIMCPSCYAERANDPNYDGEDGEWDEYVNRDDREEDYGDSTDEELGDMASVKDFDSDDDLDDDLDIDDDLDVLSDEEKDETDEDEEDYTDELDDDDYDVADDDDSDDDDEDDE